MNVKVMLAALWSCAGFCVAAVTIVAAGLGINGWNDFLWVLQAPDPVGIGLALEASVVVLAIALPPVVLLGFAAAGAAIDAKIGGFLAKFTEPAADARIAAASVVVGTAILIVVVSAGYRPDILSAALALAVVNLPAMTSRFAHALRSVSPGRLQAAAATGAGPVHIFFVVLARAAGKGLVAAVLITVAQMLGETAALAVASRAALGGSHLKASTFGAWPLAVDLWTRASAHADWGAVSAAALILTLIILLLRTVAHALTPRAANPKPI